MNDLRSADARRSQRASWRCVFAALFVLALSSVASAADAIEPSPQLPETTPWDLEALSRPAEFEWVDEQGPVRSLSYAGLNYRGRPTRVFAYFATPGTLSGERGGDRDLPAMVLVHGGGGTAFREWAELWAKRGYAAIAMDLAGHRPIEGENPHLAESRTRLDDGGPNQSDVEKFHAIDEPVSEHWPYHAVANIILAHSLIRSFPEVDAGRTGLSGISWGGYLTTIVASLDNRFAAAVPVYGCGYLYENSVWRDTSLKRLSDEGRERWVRLYDPSQYLPACRVPIFFVNGTNDFAYPLDSYMKSYAAVPGTKNIRVTVNMPHSHPAGWMPREIGAFVDSQVKVTPPLPHVGKPAIEGDRAVAEVVSSTRLQEAALHYTTEEGAINARQWSTAAASIENGRIAADAPPSGASAWFFTLTDERGLTVSSEVQLGGDK